MKSIVLIFTLFISLSALANKEQYMKARNLYLKKDYRASIKHIKKSFNLRQITKVPDKVLFLLSLNYRKIGSLKTEAKILRFIRKRSYAQQSEDFEKGKAAASKSLLYNYYRLGTNQYLQFKKTKNDQIRLKAIETFNIIKTNSDYKTTTVKQYLTLLGAKEVETFKDEDFIQKKKPEAAKKSLANTFSQFEYGAVLGLLNWSEKSTYENLLNNDKADITLNFTAVNAGAVAYYNKWNFLFSFKMSGFYALTNIKESSSTIDYNKSGVASFGLLTEPEAMYSIFHPNLHFGLSIPFLYRQIDFPQPDDTVIENKTIMHTGFLGTVNWRKDKLDYKGKLGLLNSEAIFNFEVGYRF